MLLFLLSFLQSSHIIHSDFINLTENVVYTKSKLDIYVYYRDMYRIYNIMVAWRLYHSFVRRETEIEYNSRRSLPFASM